MANMTKQEVLNAIIDLTKTTGQGLSAVVAMNNSHTQLILDELVAEKYITKHTESYSYLPDDTWYMPKGCYNMWEDGNGGRNITFVRMFLGINDLGLGIELKDVLCNKEFVKDYSDWLAKNIKQLSKIKTLDYIMLEPGSNSFTKEEVDYIRSRGWYGKNLTADACLVESHSALDNEVNIRRISKELVELYKLDTKYASKLKEQIEYLAEAERNIAFRNKLHVFLSGKKEPIQTII